MLYRGTLATIVLLAALATPSSAQAQFETRAVFPVGDVLPFALVVGDFNRDGIPDVADTYSALLGAAPLEGPGVRFFKYTDTLPFPDTVL